MSEVNLFRPSSLANIAAAHPLRFFDIGARGGFDPGLWPFAFATEAVGFEPDPVAFEKLAGAPETFWKKTQILPVAIGGENGMRTLHLPADPQAASLLGPSELTGPARTKDHFFKINETLEVETQTMDHVLQGANGMPPEYLKIDIEGAELEVLKNSPQTVKHLLAVKVEVAFDHFRAGQPMAADIMSFLESAGFVLMDFTGPSYWRTQSNIVHPLMDKAPMYYSRGQLVHVDFLYFRRPERLAAEEPDSAVRKMQLGLIAMSFGYFDFAADVYGDADVQREARRLGCEKPSDEILTYAKIYGRIEAKKAFVGRLRGFGPHLRRFANLLFR